MEKMFAFKQICKSSIKHRDTTVPEENATVGNIGRNAGLQVAGYTMKDNPECDTTLRCAPIMYQHGKIQ